MASASDNGLLGVWVLVSVQGPGRSTKQSVLNRSSPSEHRYFDDDCRIRDPAAVTASDHRGDGQSRPVPEIPRYPSPAVAEWW